MGDCKLCRYKFRRKTLSNSRQTIDLVDTKEDRIVAHMQFIDVVDKITIEFIIEVEKGKGHGLRLLRSLQCIAKRRKKTLITKTVLERVRFFNENGFKLIKKGSGIFIMEWKATG